MNERVTLVDTSRTDAAPSEAGGRFADAGAWRRLLAPDGIETICDAWLSLFCAQVDVVLGPATGVNKPVLQAIVAIGDPQANKFARAANYGSPGEVALGLSRAAERALQVRRAISQVGEAPKAPCQLAYPIVVGDKLYGVVALEMVAAAAPQLDLVMRLAQWGVAWFARIFQAQRVTTDAESERMALQVAALGHCASGATVAAAAETLATGLADRLGAQKISIGIRRGLHTRLLAMSHGGFASVRNDFIAAVEAAMDEAVDANCAITYPVGAGDAATPHAAHARLCRNHDCDWSLTVPVEVGSETPGSMVVVVTAEGREAVPEGLEQRIGDVAGFVGPLIVARRQSERSLSRHAFEATSTQVKSLWRARLGRSAVVLAGLAMLIALLFVTDEYRVTARASMEGSIRRTVVAPFDGYILDATARPGDKVLAGSGLARLDDRELKLQKLDLESRLLETRRQIDEAMGLRDVAKTNILSARGEAIEAELGVIKDNLARTALVAPFDAYVVSGDKTQSIGAPMRRGDTAYELSPLDSFRVELYVPQSDFDEIAVGQEGRLLLSSLPYVSFAIRTVRITPIATPRDGETVFRVDADLLDADPVIRLGMQGVARINVGPRPLVWIWSHGVLDWLRIKLWEWLP